MNTKYTEGTWAIIQQEYGEYRIACAHPEQGLVKICTTFRNKDGEANAALIAAAPELLGIVQEIADHAASFEELSPESVYSIGYVSAELINKARAAILKATTI